MRELYRGESARAEAMQAARVALYRSRFECLVGALRGCRASIAAMQAPGVREEVERNRGELGRCEELLTLLHQAWLEVIAEASNVDFLAQVRRLGEKDVRDLSKVIGDLKEKLAAIPIACTPGNPNPPASVPVNAAPAKVSAPKVKLDGLKVPKFDGDLLEFSTFKQNFEALVVDQGYKDEVCLLFLKQAIPDHLHYLLTGLKKMSEAWERLEYRYGDT